MSLHLNLEEYPYVVVLPMTHSVDPPRFVWAKEVIGRRNFATDATMLGKVNYHFRNEKDAVLFALKWS